MPLYEVTWHEHTTHTETFDLDSLPPEHATYSGDVEDDANTDNPVTAQIAEALADAITNSDGTKAFYEVTEREVSRVRQIELTAPGEAGGRSTPLALSDLTSAQRQCLLMLHLGKDRDAEAMLAAGLEGTGLAQAGPDRVVCTPLGTALAEQIITDAGGLYRAMCAELQ